MDNSVVSWPPCRDWVEVNTAAGFPASAPDTHRLEVLSRKYFRGAAMLPKRVGLPSTSPSAVRRSSSVTYGGPLGGIGMAAASLSADTAGTVRSRAWAPAVLSMPRQTCRASSAVEPLRE